MSSMAIWRMANQQLRDSFCFPAQTRPGAATLHTIGETSPEASSTCSGGRGDCWGCRTPGRQGVRPTRTLSPRPALDEPGSDQYDGEGAYAR